MKSLKVLFSSALALIAIIMLSLFTSCSSPEQNANVDADNAPVRSTANTASALEPMDNGKVSAETLNVNTADKVSSQGISVLSSATCTAIESHLPRGSASEFSKEVGRVYLHTQIKMPEGQSANLQHVWKRNGKTVSTVDLSIKGPTFRTWSYKTITKKMTGTWTVDVQTAAGEILETASFEVN